MSGRRHGRQAALAAVSLAALAVLNGCATLGGNVKGSFSCPAPDGICAPSSTIDDRALAMIAGDAGDTVIPAGPYQAPAQQPRAMRTAMTTPVPMADRQRGRGVADAREGPARSCSSPTSTIAAGCTRRRRSTPSSSRNGRLRRSPTATPIPDRNPAARPTDVSLADAVDRAGAGLSSTSRRSIRTCRTLPLWRPPVRAGRTRSR